MYKLHLLFIRISLPKWLPSKIRADWESLTFIRTSPTGEWMIYEYYCLHSQLLCWHKILFRKFLFVCSCISRAEPKLLGVLKTLGGTKIHMWIDEYLAILRNTWVSNIKHIFLSILSYFSQYQRNSKEIAASSEANQAISSSYVYHSNVKQSLLTFVSQQISAFYLFTRCSWK